MQVYKSIILNFVRMLLILILVTTIFIFDSEDTASKQIVKFGKVQNLRNCT